MRPTIAILFALAAVAATAAGADAPPEGKATLALRGLDPVALIEGKELAGVEPFASTRGRFLYRFADAAHKARFDADPARYAAQGEMCTVMPRVPASPEVYLVHGGKIYLFGSPHCRGLFEEDPAKFLARAPRKRVAIFVFEGMELLDFAGPGEVFANAGQGRAFDVYTVAASAAPVKSQGFASITPQYTLADCPKPDILVLPGGATRIPRADPSAIAWIRRAAGESEITLSVCTGALLLAEAGLLDGLEATTHHEAIAALGAAAPRATVREGRRYVDNGRVVTSAGVSAGIDASLHVVARLLGPGAAADTAKLMEYRWEPERFAATR